VENLTIDLFEPGMGPLHRAGLGGLAATLRWIEERVEPARRPPGRWSVDDRMVIMSWDTPEGAGPFFRRLYELAFQLDEGLIWLAGAYGELDISPIVRAELQQGMLLTILQYIRDHAQFDKSNKTSLKNYEIDGQSIQVQHLNLLGYSYRDAWKELIDPKTGKLISRVLITGKIAPGFASRHASFKNETSIEQSVNLVIALHFALVGTLSLAINRSSAVLIIPDVEDLAAFANSRGRMTPRNAKECRVSSPADAALQAFIRLRKAEVGELLGLQRCLAVLFTNQKWNGQQKTRAAVLDIEPDYVALERFEVAMLQLPPRLVVPTNANKKGEVPDPFWVDSFVRPLVAENLARDRPWFEDFRRLIVGPDGHTSEDKVRQLGYEQKGLQVMIEQPWSDKGEETLVRAVHQAMNQHFGRIWEESKKNETTSRNRRERQMQRWRLTFSSAKTADDVRNGLADLWSRAGHVRLLSDSWRSLLPILCDETRWKLNRDLALLALASYSSPAREETNADSEPTEELVEDDA
jgi:CRISPR-associated protein Cas8a1/Csx13